ncbi:MAG: OsmC family protein [Actinomycetia bacterium]|nr:OsmC family protein [Actinomycetes bacterium]
MDMEVYFPGNKKVYARYKGFVIETDQPARAGGDESAPAPFDLFLASIGTCAGIYVLSFLEQRGLSTDGAGIVLRQERDPDTKLVSKISLEIKLPADFPEKYRDAVIRAADMCAVKRHLDNPPVFETYTTIDRRPAED